MVRITRSDGLLGDYLGTNELPRSHHLSRGVHTFSVVPDGDGGYLAYAGPVDDGVVELWESPDLRQWGFADTNPTLFGNGVRWPSVLRSESEYYMAVRTSGTLSTWEIFPLLHSGSAKALRRLKNVYRILVDKQPFTSIDLYHSESGREFDRVGTLVERGAHGSVVNQNPFLFEDPVTGNIGLVYYSGDFERWRIRCRWASTVAGLADGDDQVLLTADRLVAAPSIFYHPNRERYYLLGEGVDRKTGNWTTTVYPNGDIESGFDLEDEVVIFDDDQACPFPFVEDDQLFLFTSQRSEGERWQGRIHKYSLEE